LHKKVDQVLMVSIEETRSTRLP